MVVMVCGTRLLPMKPPRVFDYVEEKKLVGGDFENVSVRLATLAKENGSIITIVVFLKPVEVIELGNRGYCIGITSTSYYV